MTSVVQPLSIIASAPGSLMLLGEHAVLHGRLSLVLAVSQRLRVTLSPRVDAGVTIESELGSHATTLDTLAPHPSFRFVLGSVGRVAPRLSHGFDLRIESEFSHTIGFGSSAAVTVATLAALHTHAGEPVAPVDLLREARDVIRSVQGRGSGADAAASVFGGIVAYRAEPLEVEALPAPTDWIAVYSGSKTPTPEVIRFVDERWRGNEAGREAIHDAMERIAREARDALKAGDVDALGRCLDEGQEQMDRLGVGTPVLSEIVGALRADRGIRGAKISGSGLGDCAIGLGRPTAWSSPYASIPVTTATQGVLVGSSLPV